MGFRGVDGWLAWLFLLDGKGGSGFAWGGSGSGTEDNGM